MVTNTLKHCLGLWRTASFINHSCVPNTRRAFIGDIMIFRAQRDLPVGTELTINYCPTVLPLEQREKRLESYSFRCSCQQCVCERQTKKKAFSQREGANLQLFKEVIESPSVDAGIFGPRLNAIEKTYKFPASEEPRRTLIFPCINLIRGCVNNGLMAEAFDIGMRLLKGMGFEVEVTATNFIVKRWGAMEDEVVAVLAFMWRACGQVAPALDRNIEDVLRTAYTMVSTYSALSSRFHIGLRHSTFLKT